MMRQENTCEVGGGVVGWLGKVWCVMTTNQEMFLYAVEEMSFTRAAARAFVTQQCLSDHIRRLEEFYGVRLFDRSPRLKLTTAGETLYQALCQIQGIEKSVQQEFSGEGETARGTLALGIHPSRARHLLADTFSAFRLRCPNVTLSVELDETQRLLSRLLEGRIDLFLGVDCPPHPQIQKEALREEPIYLLATEALLQRCLSDWNGTRRFLLPQELTRLPLAANPSMSTVAQAVEQFLMVQDITVDVVCRVGDYHTQLSLCRMDQAALFCPESFLQEIVGEGQKQGEPPLRILRVKGLEKKLRVELITRTGHFTPRYVQVFQSILKERYQTTMNTIRAEG